MSGPPSSSALPPPRDSAPTAPGSSRRPRPAAASRTPDRRGTAAAARAAPGRAGPYRGKERKKRGPDVMWTILRLRGGERREGRCGGRGRRGGRERWGGGRGGGGRSGRGSDGDGDDGAATTTTHARSPEHRFDRSASLEPRPHFRPGEAADGGKKGDHAVGRLGEDGGKRGGGARGRGPGEGPGGDPGGGECREGGDTVTKTGGHRQDRSRGVEGRGGIDGGDDVRCRGGREAARGEGRRRAAPAAGRADNGSR